MTEQIVDPYPTAAIHIVQYLDGDGDVCFVVKRDGDMQNTNMSTWIGLLELAKDALLREYNGMTP